MRRFLLFAFLLACPSPNLFGQAWSGILDPSRATDWTTGVGFTIPSYTVPCATQPTLTAGSPGADSANAAAITAAISSCDATHNVISIGSGSFYVAGVDFGSHSKVVVRGASPSSTQILLTPPAGGCGGYPAAGICADGNSAYAQSSIVAPGAGNNVCSWTGGLTQGSTSITLSSCGNGAPAVGTMLVLDQADGTTDNGGVWICSGYDNAQNISGSFHCLQNALGVNAAGRLLDGSGNFCNPGASNNTGNCLQHSQQQVTEVIAVSGSGPYTVTISPGVYFNNVVSGKQPGAWWASTQMQLAGIENLTINHSNDASTRIGALFIWCKDCWMQNVRSIAGTPVGGVMVNHVAIISSFQTVIQNNYFYGSQHTGSNSYCIQMLEDSAVLVQNNIMQNTTSPDIKDAVSGSVTAFNFTPYINFGTYVQGLYASHNSGSAKNLIEGNVSTSAIGDDVWGTSGLITIFRNHFVGWQPGYTNQTNPIIFNFGVRGNNVIGNVMGEPGYHNQYSLQANSTTTTQHQTNQSSSPTSGSGNTSTSIYELGTTDTSGLGNCTTPPVCDSLVFSTLFRWGNYDTVTGAAVFDSAESSPGAVAFINSQSTPGSHTLPDSFYLSSKPVWFGTITWPPIGPDVSSGTQKICSGGTYAGLWNTSASLTSCTGGSLVTGWGGHANAIPAEVCYLSVMHGPPDGSGGVLTFDPSTCYASSPPTLVSIAITPASSPSVAVGSTINFTATGTYSDSSTANITTSVTWVSSNTGKATINSSGVATGVAAGTTTISCSLSAVNSSPNPTLTVTTPPTGIFTGPIFILSDKVNQKKIGSHLQAAY